jgi:hypothetical protein
MTRTKVEEMRNLAHNTIILALMALPTIYIVRILRDKLEMQLRVRDKFKTKTI